MKIQFSRHAKRRAKLYKISESTIIGILKDIELSPGKNEIIKDITGWKFPLKIVALYENDVIMVVTNYPLKKERRK